jgi:hypothetical protein
MLVLLGVYHFGIKYPVVRLCSRRVKPVVAEV